MKKKLVAGIMSAMLVAGMVMPVSAADPNNELDVQYSLGSTYTLSIPIDVTVLDANGGSAKVGVSAVNTTPTEKVQVTITSGINNSNQIELERENNTDTKVVSAVTDSKGTALSNGSVVAEFQDMSTTAITGGNYGDGTINFGPLADSQGDDTIKAGTYNGTIVFGASIEDR